MSLSYDPFGRLYQYTAGGASTYFSYLGSRMAGELTYNGSSYTAVRDYAYDGAQPFLWPNSFWAIWGGSGGGDFRFLQQDRLGSVIATSNLSGAVTPYAYGPYGEPQSWSGSRFRYTGQIALPEAQLYHYNARAYDPMLGRFLQTDPIRYGDGGNIYAYVHGDPVNGTDPSGLMGDDNTVDALVITANLKDPLQHLDLQLSDLKINFDIDINISVADLAGFNFTGPKCDSEGSCVSTDLDSVTVIGAKHPRLTGVADFDSLGGVPIAVAVSVTPAPQSNQPGPLACRPSNSWMTKTADALDKFSTAASGVGLVTGGAALVTSETIVGGIGFGTVSGVSFAASTFASGGAAVLNFAAHRYGNAAIDVFGVGASGAVGLAAKEMKPAVQLMRNAYGVGAGAAASSMCP